MHLHYLKYLFIGLFFWTACAEKEEGCLDIEATNYDVTADEDCCAASAADCCCTYPELTLAVQHKLGKDSLNNNADFSYNQFHTVAEDSSHYFVVNDIRFYLSHLELLAVDGTSMGITDSIEIEVVNSEGNLELVTVEDNFSLIKRTITSYTLGNYTGSNTFDSIRFNIGITEPTNHVLLESLPERHVLNGSDADSLYIGIEEGFVFNKMEIKRDTFAELDSILLNINTLSTITLPLVKTLEIEKGFNASINLRINYLEWFKGIDFAVDTDDSIKNQVFSNTLNVFETVH